MTWTCDSLDLHMDDPGDLMEAGEPCPQPVFLLDYMLEHQTDDARHRFYSAAEITMNAEGRTIDTERAGNNDVWCAECGESATNREGDSLLDHYVELALNRNWQVCAHGDGDNPVIVNCDACLETHVNAEAHRGLEGQPIWSIDQFRDYRTDTRRIERELHAPRVRARRAMPPEITASDGTTWQFRTDLNRYVAKRPPPRTLHDLGHTNGR